MACPNSKTCPQSLVAQDSLLSANGSVSGAILPLDVLAQCPSSFAHTVYFAEHHNVCAVVLLKACRYISKYPYVRIPP